MATSRTIFAAIVLIHAAVACAGERFASRTSSQSRPTDDAVIPPGYISEVKQTIHGVDGGIVSNSISTVNILPETFSDDVRVRIIRRTAESLTTDAVLNGKTVGEVTQIQILSASTNELVQDDDVRKPITIAQNLPSTDVPTVIDGTLFISPDTESVSKIDLESGDVIRQTAAPDDGLEVDYVRIKTSIQKPNVAIIFHSSLAEDSETTETNPSINASDKEILLPNEDGYFEDGRSAPNFDLSLKTAEGVTTFEFTCKTSTADTGANQTCGDVRTANLIFKAYVLVDETQKRTAYELEDAMLNGTKVSEMAPKFVSSGKGGFSVTSNDLPGSKFQRLVVVLSDYESMTAKGIRYYVRELTPGTVSLDAKDPAVLALWSGESVSTIEEGGSSKFSVAPRTNQQRLFSSYVAIDPDATYRLTGVFKSGGNTESEIYLGIDTFDANFQRIAPVMVFRQGDAGTIITFDDISITTSGTLSGWYGAGASYYRSLGIYYDGDTTKVPDAMILNFGTGSTNPNEGAYSSVSGSSINLNSPFASDIAAKIVLGITKVMNHKSSSSFAYCAANGKTVPKEWTNYGGNVVGTSALGTVSDNKFRFGTKYIRIVLLPNYRQDSSSTLLFDHITFEKL